jgi:S-adenosylmethionine:tRNA ribosyltransferase-isomerase
MRTSDLDYDLPDRLIAQEPLEDRAASRLLVLRRSDGGVEHRAFRDLPGLLAPGDLLVRNTTRVTARRFRGKRESGGAVEFLALSWDASGGEALVRPAKRVRPGQSVEVEGGFRAVVLEDLGAGRKRFRWEGAPPGPAAGETPLPPYVRRKLADEGRYQTVYADEPGSAAAPTAGLHFDAGILAALEARGVGMASVSLSVGLDTFRPVQAEDLASHPMHGEAYDVPVGCAEAVAECRGRVVAVGTTTCRTLEAASTGPRALVHGRGEARLFIQPGYRFQTVDALLTNFHMPRTTMLAMVAAFVGAGPMLAAYREAVAEEYRFLSFGDAMLVM